MTRFDAILELNEKLRELREAGFIIRMSYQTDGGEEVDTVAEARDDENTIIIFWKEVIDNWIKNLAEEVLNLFFFI